MLTLTLMPKLPLSLVSVLIDANVKFMLILPVVTMLVRKFAIL